MDKVGVLWVLLFLASVRRHILAASLRPPRLPTSLYSKPPLSSVHHVTGAARDSDLDQRWDTNTKQLKRKEYCRIQKGSHCLWVSPAIG